MSHQSENVTGVMKKVCICLCCSKTAEENKENTIKINVFQNSKIINNLHQVNIMLVELDLRMLPYLFSQKTICSEEQG